MLEVNRVVVRCLEFRRLPRMNGVGQDVQTIWVFLSKLSGKKWPTLRICVSLLLLADLA